MTTHDPDWVLVPREWRKRPVVIEAVRWTGENWDELGDWMGYFCTATVDDRFVIRTLEGDMLADVGDWIIKGVKGEFYPCKPDIFAATYEPAFAPPPPSREPEPAHPRMCRCLSCMSKPLTPSREAPDWVLVPRSVLEPFAREAAEWRDGVADNKNPWIATDGGGGGAYADFTIGDLRRLAALSSTPPPPSRDDRVAKLEEALRGLLREYYRNTCQHEKTYRGGAIWTICSGCGRRWADDQGGFVAYEDPPAVSAARSALGGQDAK